MITLSLRTIGSQASHFDHALVAEPVAAETRQAIVHLRPQDLTEWPLPALSTAREPGYRL